MSIIYFRSVMAILLMFTLTAIATLAWVIGMAAVWAVTAFGIVNVVASVIGTGCVFAACYCVAAKIFPD